MNEELENLIKVQAFIEAAKNIIQGEGVAGGHRGVVDEYLTSCSNIIFDEIESKKSSL